jgi:hypothetical protein
METTPEFSAPSTPAPSTPAPSTPAPSTEELAELEAEFARLETELEALDDDTASSRVEGGDG